jgi:cytoskeletal protein CcmA (bactofilin family)
MNNRVQIRVFLAVVLTASIILVTGLRHFVQARELTDPSSLAAGQVIDNDIFVAMQQVTIDGTVNGDVFVLGNQVVVNGEVNGSLFAVGQNVEIQGKVSGTTYAAAISMKLGPSASLQRNLYYAGGVFSALDGAKIQRDLNTICLDAKISGQIGRNTNAMIGILNLIEFIIQSLSGVINFPEWMLQPIGYTPSPAVGGPVNALLVAYITQEVLSAGALDTVRLAAWGLDLLRQFGLLLVLGLIAIWLLPKPLSRSAQELQARPLASLGYGLLGLFIIGNVYLAGLLVAILVFVTGLWIGFLGLWDFTIAFWILGFSALCLILALLGILVAFGSKLIVANLAGNWLLDKLAPKTNLPKFLGLAIGILIYSLLRSIPMLGWVIGVLVIAWGVGCVWLAYRKGGLCCCETSNMVEASSVAIDSAAELVKPKKSVQRK